MSSDSHSLTAARLAQAFCEERRNKMDETPAGPGNFVEPRYATPPQRSNRWIWLLGGCGCSTMLLTMCCAGVVFLGLRYSSNLVAQKLQQQLAGNQDVERTLGEIESLDANLVDSGEEQRKRGGPNNWVVLDAVGSKGKGQFVIETPTAPDPERIFETIELRLEDGTLIKIR